jgi:Amt family ammonium transporter
VICYTAVAVIKLKFSYDDSLDAFGVHGVGGTVGALATGLFAQKIINSAGNNGLLFGNSAQFVTQAIGVLTTLIYSVTVTFILLKILDALMGLRVSDEEEVIGLDITQHEESAYTLLD